MPAVSKRQFRFLKAIENGSIKNKSLSPKEAKEYTSHNTSYKDLPEKAKKKRFKKLLD